uniref:Cytoplasmic tRNA 2-thiolation protein 2 n=1 Tax=Globodera rostochiensis TaxID=31243 RepID=A0A914HAI7_GLORO
MANLTFILQVQNSVMTPCLKCSEEDGSFFQLENTKVAGYCRECFSKMIRQKFAFCLGKNRVFKEERRRDALLVYYSGAFESLQLLRLVCEAVTDQKVHKRLRLNAQVLYLSSATTLDKMMQDSEHCRLISHNFPDYWIWHFAHESAILNDTCIENSEQNLRCCSLEEVENLQLYNKLFESCQSNSVRDELKRLFRTKLICRLSEVRFKLHFVSAEMSSMVDSRFEPIQLVRPLRDISDRELKAMLHIDQNGINQPAINENAGMIMKGGESSLQTLTADFIQELRGGGFPATISTILSVASKVENKDVGRISVDEGSALAIATDKHFCQICAQLLSDFAPNSGGINVERFLVR